MYGTGMAKQPAAPTPEPAENAPPPEDAQQPARRGSAVHSCRGSTAAKADHLEAPYAPLAGSAGRN